MCMYRALRVEKLQKLADETGLTMKVRPYPPGTSKADSLIVEPVLSA